MLILKTKPWLFKIKNKDGQVQPFTPNLAQKRILNKIEKDIKEKGKTRLIIVKGRQLGISTLIESLLNSYALTVPAFTGYCMAHDATTANDLFDKIIKFQWQNLNENIKNLYKTKRDNTRQLMFEGYMNSSSVTVGLSGRGSTIDFLHVSEAGKISENKKLWDEMISGTFPASEKAKGIVIESTADGGLGPFYEMVQASLAGKTQFEVIFLCWTGADEYRAKPPNNNDWIEEYKILARNYELSLDPVKEHGIDKNQLYWYYLKASELKEQVKVQYPFTIEEAFVSRSQNFFTLPIVQRAIQNARSQKYIEKENFKIWKTPTSGHVYAIGVDCATGESNDNTSIQVFDTASMEQVAEATGKFTEELTAIMAVNAGRVYNNAYIGVEVNNMGRAVQNFVQRFEYPEERIYKRLVPDITNPKFATIPKYGWLTSSTSRPEMLTEFRRDFENDEIKINSLETLQEMAVFINNDGKFEAQDGYHDDRVMACMIARQVIDYARSNS